MINTLKYEKMICLMYYVAMGGYKRLGTAKD